MFKSSLATTSTHAALAGRVRLFPTCAALAVVLLAVLVDATVARADPIVLSTSGERPALAVDAAGTAHVVWNEPLDGVADVLHYCRLPRGAAACDATQALVPPESVPQFNDDSSGPEVVVTGPQDVSLLTARYPNVVVVDSTGTPTPDCFTMFPLPSQECLGSGSKTWIYRSLDAGASFGTPKVFSHVAPSGGAIVVPATPAQIATVTRTQSGGTYVATAAPDGYVRTPANVGADGPDRAYGGTLAATSSGTPVAAFTDLASNLFMRESGGSGPLNDVATWRAAQLVGVGEEPHLAGGPGGVYLLYRPRGEGAGDSLVVRRWADGALRAPIAVSDPSGVGDADLFQDGSGRLHAAWVRRGDAGDTLRYRSASDGAAFGAVADLASGAARAIWNVDVGAAADGAGWAAWSSTSSGKGTISITPLAPAGAGIDPPRNTAPPRIEAGAVPRLYTCDEGTWTGSPQFTYEWLRVAALGKRAPTVVGRDPGYLLKASEVGVRFICRVTATNAGGTATATSVATILSGVRAVPPRPLRQPYGNVRIRGIDVFQVVQPLAGAPTFAFPDGGFPGMAGGGTPTNWVGGILTPLRLRPGTTAQSVAYEGVPLDDGKPTTAVVYVSMEGPTGASDPNLALTVTVSVRLPSGEYTRLTKTLRNPRASTAPVVSLAERVDPALGLQFELPAGALWAAGGTNLTLEARVALPVSSTVVGQVQCAAGGCDDDDRFVLRGIPVGVMPTVSIMPVALTQPGQAPFPSPRAVLARALQVWPGGEKAYVPGAYVGSADISVEATRSLSDHECDDLDFTSVRSCRMYLVANRLMTWRWDQVHAGTSTEDLWDVVLGVHDFSTSDANGPFTEPGWRSGELGQTLETYTRGFAKPLFTATARTRPFTAAAHEYGHVLGAPHADQTCGGNAGGQKGEPWPPDNSGRLQAVRWDRTVRVQLGSPPKVNPDADTTAAPLYDLMSYCAADGTPATAWVSPRNWNRAFQTLEGFRARRARMAAWRAPLAASDRTFVTGIVTATAGRITHVRPGDGGELAVADLPASPVRVQALAADGTVLADAGVALEPTSEGGDAAAFEVTVPSGAAQLVLLRAGAELHRLVAGQPPTVTVRAPRRGTWARAGRDLDVAWTAADTDSAELQAVVDLSADGGRTWRTVYDGPSTGRVRVPAKRLAATGSGRVRVSVSDGFNEVSAMSATFRADGARPEVTITSPAAESRLEAGGRVSLAGGAIDDRLRPLTGRRLTWFDGARRLGTGERLTTRLGAGRHVLRLVARDATARIGRASVVVQVAPAPLRLLDVRGPERVGASARRVRVRLAVSAPAVVRGAGGRRYDVGPRLRTVELALPARPAVGVLDVPLVVRATSPDATGTVRFVLPVLRVGR